MDTSAASPDDRMKSCRTSMRFSLKWAGTYTAGFPHEPPNHRLQPVQRTGSFVARQISPILERPAPAPRHRPQPKPQRVQLDEPLSIDLIVRALIILERHHFHRIQAVRTFPPDAGDVALVQLHSHPPGHAVLAGIDQCLQHPPLGAEPEAVVD